MREKEEGEKEEGEKATSDDVRNPPASPLTRRFRPPRRCPLDRRTIPGVCLGSNGVGSVLRNTVQKILDASCWEREVEEEEEVGEWGGGGRKVKWKSENKY